MKQITSPDALLGKKFVAYGLGRPSSYIDNITANRRRDTFAVREVSQNFTFRNGLECVDKRCGTLLTWSEDQLLWFDAETGNLGAWWIAH